MKARKSWQDKDIDNIPKELLKIIIIISFDMGWNKRTTRKSYDSLSGHAFMIRCQTGMIIGLTTNKKMQHL